MPHLVRACMQIPVGKQPWGTMLPQSVVFPWTAHGNPSVGDGSKAPIKCGTVCKVRTGLERWVSVNGYLGRDRKLGVQKVMSKTAKEASNPFKEK